MKAAFGVCVVLLLASCYYLISVTPRLNVVHVPGVGQVVWQQGSSKRWVVFPEEKCR